MVPVGTVITDTFEVLSNRCALVAEILFEPFENVICLLFTGRVKSSKAKLHFSYTATSKLSFF